MGSVSTFRAGLGLVLLAGSLVAQPPEWPGFRGPTRDGIATGRPPFRWQPSSNPGWKVALPGPGSSSPVVAGDRVFVTCYSGYGDHLDDGGRVEDLRLHLVCLRRRDGKALWTRTFQGGLRQAAPRFQCSEHGFATPTPVTDGRRVFAYFGSAGLIAVDLHGEVLWRAGTGSRDPKAGPAANRIERDGKQLRLRWGAAASPVLHGGLVLVNASEESDSIRAYHQDSGALAWTRVSAELQGCASTPILATHDRLQVAVVSLAGEVWALHPGSGDLVWRVETGSRGGLSPTPVADGERVYIFGGNGPGLALALGPLADPTGASEAPRRHGARADDDLGETAPELPDEPRVVWRGSALDIPSPVLHRGKLLLVGSRGVATCVDAVDGEVLFRGRLPGRTGTIYASPIVANHRLFVVSRRRGTFVYSADGKFDLVQRNLLADDSPFQASPAVAGDALFLRSDRFLHCIRNPVAVPEGDRKETRGQTSAPLRSADDRPETQLFRRPAHDPYRSSALRPPPRHRHRVRPAPGPLRLQVQGPLQSQGRGQGDQRPDRHPSGRGHQRQDRSGREDRRGHAGGPEGQGSRPHPRGPRRPGSGTPARADARTRASRGPATEPTARPSLRPVIAGPRGL